MDIKNKIKSNEALSNAFIFLYCAKRCEELGHVNKGFFSNQISWVGFEDVDAYQKYSDEEFEDLVDMVIGLEGKDLMVELIQEGHILPAFVGEHDLKLGVTYIVREPIRIQVQEDWCD